MKGVCSLSNPYPFVLRYRKKYVKGRHTDTFSPQSAVNGILHKDRIITGNL